MSSNLDSDDKTEDDVKRSHDDHQNEDSLSVPTKMRRTKTETEESVKKNNNEKIEEAKGEGEMELKVDGQPTMVPVDYNALREILSKLPRNISGSQSSVGAEDDRQEGNVNGNIRPVGVEGAVGGVEGVERHGAVEEAHQLGIVEGIGQHGEGEQVVQEDDEDEEKARRRRMCQYDDDCVVLIELSADDHDLRNAFAQGKNKVKREYGPEQRQRLHDQIDEIFGRKSANQDDQQKKQEEDKDKDGSQV